MLARPRIFELVARSGGAEVVRGRVPKDGNEPVWTRGCLQIQPALQELETWFPSEQRLGPESVEEHDLMRIGLAAQECLGSLSERERPSWVERARDIDPRHAHI
jgi:hypothetical protein